MSDTAGEQEPPVVMLYDYFDDYTLIRVAQPQPQYDLVQMNVTRKGEFISLDIKVDDLIDALSRVLGPRFRDAAGGES